LLPDLVIQDASIGAAGHLTLVIGNQGNGALAGKRVSVSGIDASGATLFSETTAPLNIPVSGAVNVELTFRPTTPGTITVILNGDNAVEELGATNNRRQVTISER
jgi:hypothetical protein